MFNGCVKAYFAKGPLNMALFSDGLKKAFGAAYQKDAARLRDLTPPSFFSANIPAVDSTSGCDLFAKNGNTGGFYMTIALKNIARAAYKVFPKFQATMEKILAPYSDGTLAASPKIPLHGAISDD